MSQLKSGTILRERYHIVGLIGAGGMGAVYLADDERLSGRQCAVKEQIFTTTLSSAAQAQFHQEASILARLDHPGLPKVSDYFSEEDAGRDYLVMDYVAGQNLEQLLKKAGQDNAFLLEETVLAWMNQLCDVLVYLHTRKPMVLHRDIKPANIKLTPENRLKLVDFGLAKPFDPGDPSTVTGLQGLGSLPYTPLEQYVEHLGHTDARADVYALGATCYHLLTGQTPASAHSRFLKPETLVPCQTLNPRISSRVSEAITWAMHLHPADRAPSVEAWHAALSEGAPVAVNTVSHRISPEANAVAAADEPEGTIAISREMMILFVIALVLLILALVMTFGV